MLLLIHVYALAIAEEGIRALKGPSGFGRMLVFMKYLYNAMFKQFGHVQNRWVRSLCVHVIGKLIHLQIYIYILYLV